MNKSKIRSSINEKGFNSPYVLAFTAILIAALSTWQFYKYKIANKGIYKMVTEKSKGLYVIHYNNLVIDEVSGALHVKNVEIMPDTEVYNQMVKEKKNPPAIVYITMPGLDILRIKTPKALLTKQIEGGKIEIPGPTIEIVLDDFSKQSSVYNPGKDIYKALLGKLVDIKIDSIQVSHATLIVRDRKSGSVTFKGDNMSFFLSDLEIDSTSEKDSSRILFSKNLDMSCEEIQLPSKNKKYKLHVEKLRFASQDNSFYIGAIKLVPQLTETEFARSFPTQKDRYDFMLEGISLVNINRESLWHKKIEADSFIVQKSSFKIYRDISYPRDKLSRVGKYPQQQLIQLPAPMLIKKMVFVQSFIEYKEKNAKSDSAGKVQFYKVHATLDNVTNLQAALSRNNKCTMDFHAMFLNKAPVNARLVMLLKNPEGKFSITGSIGAISALSLNPLTQPMGLARMEKGNIHSLHFDLTGNDSSSNGKLLVLYDDIKISFLKKDKEENKYAKKTLPTLAANIFIKKSNPGTHEKERVVKVRYKRDTNKSFFNLLWKSIFTGIKESVGL